MILFAGPAFRSGQAAAQDPQKKRDNSSAGKSEQKKHSGRRGRSKHNSRTSHSRERAQRAPTPERISQVQSALAAQGHYAGQPTGKWDASTVQAMKHYQQANGLPPTGKLDARTLQKLGMGSQVAGVAAPRPPAPPASPPQ